MNHLTSLQRKLVYLSGILLLFIPVIWLGRPGAQAGGQQTEADPGGELVKMRAQYDLGESSLGNVDPASATMNLVLLGLRGIASNQLWLKAQEQQKTKNWAELRATTDSIILLQPHFLKVWDFQAWNLAYNVSAEWDQVSDRYYWVKEGLKFYIKGKDQNSKYPEMYWRTGNTYMQKIGRADEWRQFRRFFVQDPNKELYPSGLDPEVNPKGLDNHFVAREYFLDANRLMDETGVAQHVMDSTLFRSYPTRALMEFAMCQQREGIFGELSQKAWQDAYNEWTKKYGMEEFDSPDGEPIRLEVTKEDEAEMRKRGEVRRLYWVDRYQNTTNYRYWRTRAKVEGLQNTIEAHREIFDGEAAYRKGDFSPETGAQVLLLRGMEKFEAMLKEYPEMEDESTVVEEGMVAQITWREALKAIEEPIPENYPLKRLWEKHASDLWQFREEFIRRNRVYR